MDIVTVLLLACLVAAFLRLFWLQVVVMRRIVRPLEREDDVGPFPFRLPGKAKRARFGTFLTDPDHADLRRKWVWSWAWTILLFLAVLAWLAWSGNRALS